MGRFAFTSAAVQVNSLVAGFQWAHVGRASWPLRVPQRYANSKKSASDAGNAAWTGAKAAASRCFPSGLASSSSKSEKSRRAGSRTIFP